MQTSDSPGCDTPSTSTLFTERRLEVPISAWSWWGLSTMTAVAVLLVGLYAFAATHWDFDVLALALPAVKVSAKFLWIQVGWPLFGFGLMALPLLAMSFQRLVAGRGLSPHQRLWLSHIECNAYALGILGSIIHLLSTGKANNGTLQGLGSLAMGLVFWIWCLWIGFETSVEEPAQSSDLSTEE